MFGKFIFARTSGKPGENDKPTAPAIIWKLLRRRENFPTNMEENKNSDKHGNHCAANILCVCRKNWQEMVRNELFTNPELITRTWCSWTGSQRKCSQVYTQLYIPSFYRKNVFEDLFVQIYGTGGTKKHFPSNLMVPRERTTRHYPKTVKTAKSIFLPLRVSRYRNLISLNSPKSFFKFLQHSFPEVFPKFQQIFPKISSKV